MAQRKFTEEQPVTRTTNQQNSIGFFSLANDGDEAIVRFMINSPDDFDIVTIHNIEAGGKQRRINCLRENDHEPLSNCPLCEAGIPIKQRVYIPIIRYKKDAAGNIEAVPEIWDRSVREASRLNGFLNNYGPLSAFVSKIIRHGKHGDPTTTYDIAPNLDKRMYSDAVYPILEGAFDGYHAIGRIVQDRTAEDLKYYVATGDLPYKGRDENAQPAYDNVQPQYAQQPVSVPPQFVAPTQPAYQQPVQQAYQPAPEPVQTQFVPQQPTYQQPVQPTFEPQPNTVQRPKRYY